VPVQAPVSMPVPVPVPVPVPMPVPVPVPMPVPMPVPVPVPTPVPVSLHMSFQGAQRCAKVRKGVQGCAKVRKGVQGCAKVRKGVCKGEQGCTKCKTANPLRKKDGFLSTKTIKQSFAEHTNHMPSDQLFSKTLRGQINTVHPEATPGTWKDSRGYHGIAFK
jgi:hypothetical protein